MKKSLILVLLFGFCLDCFGETSLSGFSYGEHIVKCTWKTSEKVFYREFVVELFQSEGKDYIQIKSAKNEDGSLSNMQDIFKKYDYLYFDVPIEFGNSIDDELPAKVSDASVSKKRESSRLNGTVYNYENRDELLAIAINMQALFMFKLFLCNYGDIKEKKTITTEKGVNIRMIISDGKFIGKQIFEEQGVNYYLDMYE